MYLLYTSYSFSGWHAPPWCLHRLIVLFKVVLTTEKPFVILALIGITSQIIFLPSTLCYTDNSLQLLRRVQTTERKLWSFTGCNINSLVSNSQRDNLRQFCRTKKHKQKWYLLSFFLTIQRPFFLRSNSVFYASFKRNPINCLHGMFWCCLLKQELTMLACLPNLTDLVLKDPTSIPNPVCLLCNYATHVLYHMPRLQRLDSYDISSEQVKEAAEVSPERARSI